MVNHYFYPSEKYNQIYDESKTGFENGEKDFLGFKTKDEQIFYGRIFKEKISDIPTIMYQFSTTINKDWQYAVTVYWEETVELDKNEIENIMMQHALNLLD